MNFLDGLAETTNRAFCQVLGGYAQQAEILQYVLSPGFGPQFNPFPSLYAQNCPLSPVPVNPSPFVGGQCAAILYNVTCTLTRVSGAIQNPFTVVAQARGPIKGATFSSGAGNTTTLTIVGSPFGSNTTGLYGAGSVATNFGSPATNVNGFTVTSVARADGQPDNCGNPDPVTPPYIPGTNVYNDNVTYNDNSGNTVTIPVSLTLGYANVNVNGQLNIPINAQFNTRPEFNFNFNYTPGGNGITPDFSNPNEPLPPSCSDPGGYNPDPSIPAPPGDIPDPSPIPPATPDPAERAKLLKGCIVTTTVLDGNETIIFQQDNPDIYVPSLGYVQFRIRVGGSGAWTNDIPVKSLRTFIPCPWDAGAIEVKGTPRFGNVFQVTPVYITRTFNPTYPPDS